jgi:hypothetical protein
MPRTCDEVTKRNNRAIAIQRYTETDRFCEVSNILVLPGTTDGKLVFRALNKRNTMTDYVIPWDDENVFAACPSTLPSSAVASPVPASHGPAPAIYASGSLWVDKTWASTTDLKRGTPKYPLSYSAAIPTRPGAQPASFHKPIKVWAARVIIEGTELETGNSYTGSVDMADAFYARPGQTFTCDQDSKALDLTADGCATGFNVTFDSFSQLRRAAAVLESVDEHTTVDIAAALRIIAACVEGVHGAKDELKPEDLAVLKKLVPAISPKLYSGA